MFIHFIFYQYARCMVPQGNSWNYITIFHEKSCYLLSSHLPHCHNSWLQSNASIQQMEDKQRKQRVYANTSVLPAQNTWCFICSIKIRISTGSTFAVQSQGPMVFTQECLKHECKHQINQSSCFEIESYFQNHVPWLISPSRKRQPLYVNENPHR